MSQAERISRIHLLLRAKDVVSLKEMKAVLEVSRATLMRDIELMRDRLGASLEYDAKLRGYRYTPAPKQDRREPRFELPGLWLSPKEAYAFLTLFNVVSAIDPGFLLQFVDPMRRTLKRLLLAQEFEMRGLDSKVAIDLPDFRPGGGQQTMPAFQALLTGAPVDLTWRDGQGLVQRGRYLVRQLRMTAQGWRLAVCLPDWSGETMIPLHEIESCNTVNG